MFGNTDCYSNHSLRKCKFTEADRSITTRIRISSECSGRKYLFSIDEGFGITAHSHRVKANAKAKKIKEPAEEIKEKFKH